MLKKEQVVEKITERICEIFGKEKSDVSEATSFVEDLGAKSGNITQITTFLEDEFEVEIPFMEFRRKKTVGDAAEFVLSLVDE
ncbi:MAG: acyl carrier protein [Treponema sp.]|jgi:acyl carrier protein|nr:acyl carrier protein [Treponema sp.]